MDPSALESVSKSLESSLDFWGTMLLVATLLVVLGLVLEYGREIKDFWKHVRWPMAAFPWDKLVAISGGILVTLGVAGELFFTYKASRVETRLRENNHRIEALLTKEAGDAKVSADSAAVASSRAKASADEAKQKADAVAKQAGALTNRMEAASRKLGKLEQKVRLQGPRSRLLEDGKAAFIEALKPFAGQRVTIVECAPGGAGTAAAEPYNLEQKLLDFLGQRGAGWAVESPGYAMWTRCGNAEALNMVIFNLTADKAVKDSAEALKDTLNKLKINTFAIPANPEARQLWLQFFGADSPYELAVKDPTAVILLVGTGNGRE